MTTPQSRRTFLSGVALVLPFAAGCRGEQQKTPTAQSAAALGPSMSAAASAAAVPPVPAALGPIPTRELGKTGVRVSMLGLGGFHIGKPPELEALRIMDKAIEH